MTTEKKELQEKQHYSESSQKAMSLAIMLKKNTEDQINKNSSELCRKHTP